MSELVAICEIPWDERPDPFDGFPYLALRVAPGLHHYFLLPRAWQPESCFAFARKQIGRNQIPGALVFGPSLAIWMNTCGKENWFDETDATLRFEPGDDVLRHRCPAATSVSCH